MAAKEIYIYTELKSSEDYRSVKHNKVKNAYSYVEKVGRNNMYPNVDIYA